MKILLHSFWRLEICCQRYIVSGDGDWMGFQNRPQQLLDFLKNASDPFLGEYTYRIVNLALPQLVLAEGSEKEFRSGP
ncbi:hypothetical protein RchiOBHm_Chr2g0121531 [Rosa chinensis]|uniref:Uncharacterized protein n=1 Tax=Rosa chinensis TaxID=74649 RepID=A0A2P6RSJ8_ROSCH|nr:hypothetical protein RchiOBHm_Chr2g0121531 [Rosa chinensis]